MTAIETRLAEIRARAEAATDGPWEWAARTTVDGDKWAVFHGESTSALAMNNDGWAPDAEFIAASRTDLPALLAAVEAVRELLPSLLEAAWDDGNALGLDGWTGPERGEGPDEHAIRRRARLRNKLVDEAYEAITAALGAEG